MNISVNPELLSQYGDQIIGLSSDYTSEINAIYKIIEELGQKWHGEAAERFSSTVKGFEAELKSLGTSIEKMGEYLVGVAKTYSSFSEQMADEASRL